MKKLIFAAMLFLTACTQSNPEVQGTPKAKTIYRDPDPLPQTPRPSFPDVEQPIPVVLPPEAGEVVEAFNLHGSKPIPMDILFVIDTSGSMCGKQAQLRKNIANFVRGFLKNKKIDFQIGVTETWDSVNFGTAIERTRGGLTMQFRNGELRPVIINGRADAQQRFITPETPNLERTLADTIYLGTLDYVSGHRDPLHTGPEQEEIFSPMIEALKPEMLNGPNKGFRRAGAHYAVVVVTDAEDSTPMGGTCHNGKGACMSGEQVYSQLNELLRLEQGTTLSLYAAISRYNDWKTLQSTGRDIDFSNGTANCNADHFADRGSYNVDPSTTGPASTGAPSRIIKLVELAHGQMFDLQTRDYGNDLVNIGRSLIKKTIKYDIGPLKANVNAAKRMVVKINGKVIEASEGRGWTYDSANRIIHLNEGLELGNQDDFQVEVRYFPL